MSEKSQRDETVFSGAAAYRRQDLKIYFSANLLFTFQLSTLKAYNGLMNLLSIYNQLYT